MSYKLHSVLYGHKSDVLGLAVTQDDCILSCSRDKTAKLWRIENLTGKYVEAETYLGEQHINTKFITCICAVPPNDEFQNGLVLTGGNDNLILIFKPDCSAPIQQLSGHSNTVCKIVNSNKKNVVLSASWDATVKMWRISEADTKCILTIKIDQTSIWAVLHMKQDLIVIGSADKLIRLFNVNGILIKTLTGHEDCVRDLVEINSEEILSCSNDTTIRRWSVVTGECLEVLYGHPNYIYCVRFFKNIIVSSGEDRCLLLWSKGQHLQTITLPSRSIWAVQLLSNSDIVTGSNDGVIRIFTSDEKRQADQETLNAFAMECAGFSVPFKKYMGRSKVSRLPGPEILREPGIKEGQTKFVRENKNVSCYSWSLAEKMWKKLGNVEAGSLVEKTMNFNSKKKSPVLQEQKDPFICAVCRKTFSRKYGLRKHFKTSNHSITNPIPPYLQSVLPRKWHYYVSMFRRKGTRFKTEICLSTVNTILDLHEWIQTFSVINNCTYRRSSTKRSTRGFTAYSEFYRCQYAYVSRKSKKRRSKSEGCRSTIHVAIKRDLCGIACYTKVNLSFIHNHLSDDIYKISKPSAEVEESFRRLFESGLSPIGALHMYKKQLELKSPSERLTNDYNACPEYSWVQHLHRNVCDDINLAESIEVRNEIHNKQTEISSSAYINHVVEQTEISSNLITETESECTVPRLDDMVEEVEVEHSSDSEGDGCQILNSLEKCFDTFVDKLEEDALYYEKGILSMCEELKKACESSDKDRLSALYSFNQDETKQNKIFIDKSK